MIRRRVHTSKLCFAFFSPLRCGVRTRLRSITSQNEGYLGALLRGSFIRGSRRRSTAAFSAIALALCLQSAAPEGASLPDGGAVALFPAVEMGAGGAGGDEAKALGNALEEAMAGALVELSFRVDRSAVGLDPGGDLAAEASSGATAAGARWAAFATFDVADKRLAYTLRVYDAPENALVASAGFSAYAGLTALPLIEDSAKAIAAKAAAYRDTARKSGGGPVQYRISVTSPDEGASVYIGDPGAPSSRAAGTIRDGGLLLPYVPFEKGTRIVIGIVAKDRLPTEVPVVLGDEAPNISIPALRKVDRGNLLIGPGPGRLLGLGATYRIYMRPDWNFIFVNERVFAGYDFSPGSIPLVHAETWEGLGSYLLFPPRSPFRLGVCIGCGFLFSFSSAASPTSDSSIFMDVAIIPIEGFFEYRFKTGPTLWFSARAEYSISPSGLLGLGWIGNGPPDLSAGLLWRF